MLSMGAVGGASHLKTFVFSEGGGPGGEWERVWPGSRQARAPRGQWRLDTRRPWVILPQWCSAAQRVVRGEDGWMDPRLEFGQTSSVESW